VLGGTSMTLNAGSGVSSTLGIGANTSPTAVGLAAFYRSELVIDRSLGEAVEVACLVGVWLTLASTVAWTERHGGRWFESTAAHAIRAAFP